MRIGLISGHGHGDNGACGCGYAEADLTIEVVQKLDAVLKSMGHDTVVYPYENNAYEDGKSGGLVVDFSSCSYVLEVHFNACVNDQDGDGHVTGTEIWVTPREIGVTVEEKILNRISELGFTNRGVKKEDFLVINLVKNLGISSALIETCFIDDKDDMDLFKSRENEVVNAIANGILEGFGEVTDSVVGSEPVEDTVSDCVPTEEVEESHEKSIEELADEIYRGEWGYDPERTERLTNEYGVDIAKAAQNRVNEKYFGITSSSSDTETTSTPSIDYEVLADRIGRGDFGNGIETRIQNMASEGYSREDFQKAQDIVDSRY